MVSDVNVSLIICAMIKNFSRHLRRQTSSAEQKKENVAVHLEIMKLFSLHAGAGDDEASDTEQTSRKNNKMHKLMTLHSGLEISHPS